MNKMTRGGKAIVGALIAIVLATVMCCGWYWLITCPSLHPSDMFRIFCGGIRSGHGRPVDFESLDVEVVTVKTPIPDYGPTPNYGPVATVEAYLTQTAEANE